MDFSLTDEQNDLLNSLNNTIRNYDDNYWLDCDNSSKYPKEFVNTMAKGGWLGIAMPTNYGGSNLGVTEASLMMMLIAEKGGMTAASSIHMNIFGPNSIVKFASKKQKDSWLPTIINGQSKMCFAVTEPDTGLDTTRLKTRAVKNKDHYLLNGRKIWTSTAQITNKIMIIARTSDRNNKKPTEGLSLFYTDFNKDNIEARVINKMGRAAVDTNELFIDNLKVPIEDIIGEEGKGFSYLIHSLNPERILVAAEAYGIAKNALERAVKYANERIVFDRKIGKNQSIQHPLADAWAKLESLKLLILKAANLYDNNLPCGVESNAAKYLAAEYGMEICKQAIATHGGMGYAKEYHVERLFREMMIPYLAPVSQQLVLSYIAEKALGLPKSY